MGTFRNIGRLIADIRAQKTELLPKEISPEMLREIKGMLITVVKRIASQNRMLFGNLILSDQDKSDLKALFVWLIIDKMKLGGVTLRVDDISCCVEVKNSFFNRKVRKPLYYPKLDLEKFNPVSFEIGVINELKKPH